MVPMLGRNTSIAVAGIAIATGLSGCGGMPIAGSIVSTLADGTGYLIDGRSTGDMMLSEYMGADCTFARVFSGDYICRTHPEKAEEKPVGPAGETAVAAVYSGADDPLAAMAGTDWPAAPGRKPDFRPPRTVAELPATVAELPETNPSAAEDVPGAAQFLVVGSYRTRAAADAVMAVLDEVDTVVQTVDVLGETAFRVLAGPITTTRRVALAEELRSNGIAAAWPVLLCARTLKTLPCPAGTPTEPALDVPEPGTSLPPTVEPATAGVDV